MRMLSGVGLAIVVVSLAACSSSSDQSSDEVAIRSTEPPIQTVTTSTTLPIPGWHSGSLEIGTEGRTLGVWSHESGFVLAAAVESDGDRRLAIWRSTDGLQWERDNELGPPIERTPAVDVGPSGVVAVAAGEPDHQVLAVLAEEASWAIHEPDDDWGPPHWAQLDGNEYVDTGFTFSDVELGPQGVLVAVTRRSSLAYERAVRDALPDLTLPYEEVWVSVDYERGEVALTGIRDVPDPDCSLCGPCVLWGLAGEDLGIFSFEDVGVDPTLAIGVRNHSHARWIWQSADLKSWTLNEMLGNGQAEYNAVGPFLDTGSGYVASIGGDLGYSPDGIAWTYWDRSAEGRYFSARDLAWTGEELVVGASAHNASGPSQDSYDIWAGTFDDLRPVVVAPDDSLFEGLYRGLRVNMASGPIGTAVIGTNEDWASKASTVWILDGDDRIQHQMEGATAVAAGRDRVVVLGAVSAVQQGSSCESMLSFETYLANE